MASSSEKSISKIEALRAKVQSSQQKVVESHLSIIGNLSNEDEEGNSSSGSSSHKTLPLHKQDVEVEEENRLLKDQLTQIQIDQEKLQNEFSQLKTKLDQNSDTKLSSLKAASENDPAKANEESDKVKIIQLAKRVKSLLREKREIASKGSASAGKFNEVVEILTKREKACRNEIFVLKAEVIRLNLQFKLQQEQYKELQTTTRIQVIEEEESTRDKKFQDEIVDLQAQVNRLNLELLSLHQEKENEPINTFENSVDARDDHFSNMAGASAPSDKEAIPVKGHQEEDSNLNEVVEKLNLQLELQQDQEQARLEEAAVCERKYQQEIKALKTQVKLLTLERVEADLVKQNDSLVIDIDEKTNATNQNSCINFAMKIPIAVADKQACKTDFLEEITELQTTVDQFKLELEDLEKEATECKNEYQEEITDLQAALKLISLELAVQSSGQGLRNSVPEPQLSDLKQKMRSATVNTKPNESNVNLLKEKLLDLRQELFAVLQEKSLSTRSMARKERELESLKIENKTIKAALFASLHLAARDVEPLAGKERTLERKETKNQTSRESKELRHEITDVVKGKRESFKPTGFRQRGWLPQASSVQEMRIRITNHYSKRWKDLVVPISGTLTLHNAVYENHAVKVAHVRKWPKSVIEKIENETCEIRCRLLSNQKNVVRVFSIAELSEFCTKDVFELTSKSTDRIDFVVRCEGKMQIRNETTERFKDLDVAISRDLTLFDAIYNNNSVRAAEVRKWPNEIVQEVKEGISEIVCLLINGEGKEVCNFSIDDLKKESTLQLSDRLSGFQEFPQLILQWRKVCEAAGEITGVPLRITNEISGRFKELKLPISEDLMLYEAIYNNSVVKYAYVQLWPSEVNEAVQHKSSEIICVLLDKEGNDVWTFSIDDLKSTTTSRLIELSSIPLEKVNLVLRIRRAGIIANEANSKGIKLRVLNQTTKRWKDLVVTASDQVSLYEAVYNNPSVKSAEVHDWPSDVSRDLKNKVSKIECALLDGDEKDICSLSLDELRKTSVKDILKLSQNTKESVTFVVLKCRRVFRPTGFRQTGWTPQNATSELRIRISNGVTKRFKDTIISISKEATLFDAIYNNESVISANVRKWPGDIARFVKIGTYEIYIDLFVPLQRFTFKDAAACPEILKDALFDDEGNAVCTLSIDDLQTITTKDIANIVTSPYNLVKIDLRYKKAGEGETETVNLSDNSCSTEMIGLSELQQESKLETESLAEKDQVLETVLTLNKNLKKELSLLHAELNFVSLTSPSNGILPKYKSVLEEVIIEVDEEEEWRERVSFKPLGFRQRRWLSKDSSCLEMRLRITNESTECFKNIVLAISNDLSMYEAVSDNEGVLARPGASHDTRNTNEVFDETANVDCIVWHDMGYSDRTFSVHDLKELTTKQFFELTCRRQDLLKVLLRCQETAKIQVQELENKVFTANSKNDKLQNSLFILTSELAASESKLKRLTSGKSHFLF